MKQTNEKKQDLLLDALSCIDEDILERGLALRDGTAAPASKAADPAPKTPRPATVIPPPSAAGQTASGRASSSTGAVATRRSRLGSAATKS